MSFTQKRLKFVESTGTIRAEKQKFTDKRFLRLAKRSMLRFRRARYLWNRKTVKNLGKKCMYLTRVQNGKTYAINRSLNSVAGGKAAIMWDLNTGARDSAFQMPYPDETRLVNLLNYNEGLRYSGDYSGVTVYFAQGGSSAWLASGSPAL